jgi:subtilisin family serine protease
MAGVAGAAFQQDILYAFGGGDPRVTIAVLDGPVDRTHDCFRGARLTPLDTEAQARSGDGGCAIAHGTHIASLIFGQPCSSVEGIAPLCRGLLVPIFADLGPSCSQPELARAILLAADHGAQIINVSAGWFKARPLEQVLLDAVASCARRNILIIAAAGGDSLDQEQLSGAGGSILAVGALDKAGRPLVMQNRGTDRNPSLLAPGSNVIGAALEGGVAHRSGANFAAALVSGIAGVLLSARVSAGLPADPQAIGEAILSGAERRQSPYAQQHRRLTSRDHIQAAIDRIDRTPLLAGSAFRRPFDSSRSVSN